MSIIFPEKEREFWKKWLPTEYEQRLNTIKEKVGNIQKRCSKYPQPRWFTPHGNSHYQAVENIIRGLIPGTLHESLSESEKFFLLGSAWVHDLGMIRGILASDMSSDAVVINDDEDIREQHHTRSATFISESYQECGINEDEASIFSLLAKYHRRRCPIFECSSEIGNTIHGTIRLRLLASYLRLADALHVDQTRAPAEQYAISLAYNIPRSSKHHWIRSKFILAIDIDPSPSKHEITVHFKYPESFPHDIKLDAIYDTVIDDLTDELDSIKEVLIQADISYFLSIKKKIHRIDIDKQLKRDIKVIITDYYILDNPSSSTLINLVLDTINAIIVSHDISKSASSPAIIGAIRSFLNEIETDVLASRRCHTGLRKLVDEIQSVITGNGDLYKWEREKRDVWQKNRNLLRLNACNFFNIKYINSQQNSGKNDGSGPVNILLYGYSELVIKALCGFRDALIANQLLSQTANAVKGGNVDLSWYNPVHKNNIEKEISKKFRIFVCEGQPKNRTAWKGRVTFHDGTRYALALAHRGFAEIYIIPDAISGSLIIPKEFANSNPVIDFVMVGANGFGDNFFRHSAGHTTIIANAQVAKQLNRNGYQKPQVVLAVTSDKYGEDTAICEEEDNNQPIDGKSHTSNIEGWFFRQPFGNEKVRNTVFISQDPALRETLHNTQSIMFYNPREDRIPIKLVDVVISEKKWIVNEKDTLTGSMIIE